MGNTCSIELYKWLSVEFPEEFALIYPKDKSKYSIFHLSINLERVLLRLANALCDDYLVQLLHMEVTGESDNNGSFNLGLVRVVADGITPEQTVRDTEHFDHLCGTKSCFYAVMRKASLHSTFPLLTLNRKVHVLDSSSGEVYKRA
ncbi:hypothetical protein JHK82_049662 [Glycine max]|nr:hypothetical protein JHK82_049662 [Glycine max]